MDALAAARMGAAATVSDFVTMGAVYARPATDESGKAPAPSRPRRRSVPAARCPGSALLLPVFVPLGCHGEKVVGSWRFS
jgi:hypothetical protein